VAGILHANEASEEHDTDEGRVVMTHKYVSRLYERKENLRAPFVSPHQDKDTPTLTVGTVCCWFPCLDFLDFFAFFSNSCFLFS